MSKKPTLTDIPGLGSKLEEKLREAGIKTVAKLSKSDPEKLAAKVDGLSEKKAAAFVEAALKLAAPPKAEEKPKKTKWCASAPNSSDWLRRGRPSSTAWR
ncbi:MAG: DUF4332 domain-containing protein, partial [Promethearchaeota archaeon]